MNRQSVPNKPPPPPPPALHAPPAPPSPPPPPPPPKNPSQLSAGASICINSASLLNGGLSINSLNSAGRCGPVGAATTITQPNGQVMSIMGPGARGFVRHEACSLRSSISSHSSSLQHHHHGGNLVGVNNGISTNMANSINGGSVVNMRVCGCNGNSIHQVPSAIGCACPNGHNSISQHIHHNTSNLSDNEGCGMVFNSLACNHGCKCNTSHEPYSAAISSGSMSYQAGSGSAASRSTLLCSNGDGIMSQIESGSCMSESSARSHCGGVSNGIVHHHHHHPHHNVQLMSPSSSLSSLQPVDGLNGAQPMHRCISQATSVGGHSQISEVNNGMTQNQAIMSVPGHCSHIHGVRTCGGHHHQAGCCGHHVPSIIQQPTCNCIEHHCAHQPITAHLGQYDCKNGGGSSSGYAPSPANSHYLHHHNQDMNRSSDAGSSHNDPATALNSTAHTHNLSNSSTTTHTSSVAVKHQPLYHRQVLSRGGNRSNSSQHYDLQYGQSSAASTSSATPSLPGYQTNLSYEDANHQQALHPNKILQPPPPPRPMTHLGSKSRPQSPAAGVSPAMNAPNYNRNQSAIGQMAPVTKQNSLTSGNYMHQSGLQSQIIVQPPLPRRPLSPPSNNIVNPTQNNGGQNQQYLSSSSISSCPTQITTVRTSPSSQNQPITRLTSQAGVQNPLPNSDIPPPLPPINQRPQPIVNSLITKLQQQQSQETNGNGIQQQRLPFPVSNPIPDFKNLNLNSRTGGPSEAEKKTEALTRQIESELEQQKQKHGEPHGICPKCCKKVMPSQEACKAMNQIYHASCFVCYGCGRTLSDKTFYPVGDRVYCEEDYKYSGHLQSLKKCDACAQPILDMILPAMGKSYHPKCFRCSVCNRCLDGVPFTIDRKNKIYCVKDYHSIYSPKCAACGKSISPIDGTDETVRVVSMDKDYHIDCYCCEDCGMQLTDEEPSQSYPLDNHLLCQLCHINRRNKMQSVVG